MEIRVRGYLSLKPLIGERIIEVGPEDMSVKGLLDQLRAEIGEKFNSLVDELEKEERTRSIVILVNGRNLADGLNTRLKEADEVAIFPPMAGG